MNTLTSSIRSAIGVLTVSAAVLCAQQVFASHHGGSNGSANDAFSIEDIEINSRNGLVNAKIKRLRNTGRAKVEVRFEFADVDEVINARGLGLRQTRNATSKSPFPCNEATKTRVSIVSPQEYAGISLTKKLERKCRAGNYGGGTPNLVVVDLKRNNRGQTNARAESMVNVRVTVANDEPYGMNNNEAGGGTWHINVQGDTRSQQMRRALPGKSNNPRNRSNQYSYNTNIALGCYTRADDKYGEVKVRVDSRNNIRESNENDNERIFKIERNRCRDAG